MFSACCCSWLWVLKRDSLVTPSTSWATSAPKRSSTSVRLILGVLGDVVQEGRLDGDRVDAELGQDLGAGDGMGDVRLAGRAALAGVGLDGQVEGGVDGGEVGRRVVLGEGRLERRRRASRSTSPAGVAGGVVGARRGPRRPAVPSRSATGVALGRGSVGGHAVEG